MKVAVNRVPGSHFFLAREELERLAGGRGWNVIEQTDTLGTYLQITDSGAVLTSWMFGRSDPDLIALIEEGHAYLHVVEVPDGIEFRIIADETGVEWVVERGHIWP